MLAIAVRHPGYDGLCHNRCRTRYPNGVDEIGRPLLRAHAQHQVGGIVGPRSVVLGGESAADLVPDALGVDQHSVEVEDNGPHTVTHRSAIRSMRSARDTMIPSGPRTYARRHTSS